MPMDSVLTSSLISTLKTVVETRKNPPRAVEKNMPRTFLKLVSRLCGISQEQSRAIGGDTQPTASSSDDHLTQPDAVAKSIAASPRPGKRPRMVGELLPTPHP